MQTVYRVFLKNKTRDKVRHMTRLLLCIFLSTLIELDIKKRRPILHLVTADDDNCLENNLMLLSRVAESLTKDTEGLYSSVEGLLTGLCAAFELAHFRRIV